MKIDNAMISMQSDRSYVKESKVKETFLSARITQPNAPISQADVATISPEAQELLAQGQQSTNAVQETEKQESMFKLSDRDKQKIKLLEKLFEAMTGKKVKFRTLEELDMSDDEAKQMTSAQLRGNEQPLAPQGQRASLLFTHYSRSESIVEKEHTGFAANGIVRTQDGREIQFDLSLQMSREFRSSFRVEVNTLQQQLQDPLVLNFDGSPTSLADEKFAFDLDADGKEDQISFVRPGSGFLAVDWNKDGKVTNGDELFGVKSGDGFADLAAYDKDQNGWIDENDDIFHQLRIWEKDAQGKDHLIVLGEKGVGAIYLGNVSTEFSLTNDANQLQGQVRRSGLFLNENGTVGTAQQVDLAI